MYKDCWLHLKSRLIKFSRGAAWLSLGTLIIYSLFCDVTDAQPGISIVKIQQLEQNYKGNIQKRFRAWGKLMTDLKNQPELVKLEKVNSFFNQFEYQEDIVSRGVEDYWKSPEEFIIDGGGDCEDFAIIKYFTLVALGIPSDKLRITYVSSLRLQRAHMVLSYYPNPEAEPLILDSLEGNILKASLRPDLKPIYSFNAEGLWLAKQRNQSSYMGQSSSLSKWNDLLKRMQ
jgi:predicted transglutaminase-like cysteine proteinase